MVQYQDIFDCKSRMTASWCRPIQIKIWSITSPLGTRGSFFHQWVLMILSVYHFSLITMGMNFVISINWVPKPMRILDIKGNSCNSEMPPPHSRAHRLFLLRIKCSIIHLDMVSVYTNLHNFHRPVEGAMKLLRACFHNFQCIFHLAKLNNSNCLKKILLWH